MSLFNDSIKSSVVNVDGLKVLDLNYHLKFINEVLILEITREEDLFFMLIHEIRAQDFEFIKEE